MKNWFKKSLFSLCLSALWYSSALASPEDYKQCQIVLQNEPSNAFCKGYVKGYEAAQSSTSGNPAYTIGHEKIKFGIFQPRTPGSGTSGKELPDSFLITLPPNFKELRESGNINWATVSDPNFVEGTNTTIEIQTTDSPEGLGALKLNESISIENFIKENIVRQQTIESLEPYINTLNPETATQILVTGVQSQK